MDDFEYHLADGTKIIISGNRTGEIHKLRRFMSGEDFSRMEAAMAEEDGSKQESTLHFYEQAGYNSKDKTAFIQWL